MIQETYEHVFVGFDGIQVTVLFSQDGVCVSRSTCPDGTCVHTGMIHDSSFPIICLPARLAVTLENQSAYSIDSVSG